MAEMVRIEFRCDTTDCGATVTVDDDGNPWEAARDLGWDITDDGDRCPAHKAAPAGS